MGQDCSALSQLPKPKAVSVNGVVIAREAIAREVQNHPADKPILAWQAAARALVVRELLLQESQRLGVSAEPQRDDDGRFETDEEAAMRALIDREVSVPEADEATCRRYYAHNAQRFRTSELFEVAHILIAASPDAAAARRQARDKANAILKQLERSSDRFAALAHQHSDCKSSAAEGGRLGQIARGQTVAEFEEGLSRMAAGEMAVIETRYGFHVVRLDEKAEGRALPFELVHRRIAAYLEESVRRRALAQFVSVLAGRADIRGVNFAAAASPLVQ